MLPIEMLKVLGGPISANGQKSLMPPPCDCQGGQLTHCWLALVYLSQRVVARERQKGFLPIPVRLWVQPGSKATHEFICMICLGNIDFELGKDCIHFHVYFVIPL